MSRAAKKATRPPHREEYRSAAEAKAKLYALLDEVSVAGTEFILTHRGKPVARLSGIEPTRSKPGSFGCMKHLVRETGDIVSPLGEDPWTTPKEARGKRKKD